MALRERWCAWRDSVLIDPGFQRRAARSFFMRPIARRRARALFDLVAGFVYSQVLLACVRLDLFEILAAGPSTGAALAARCGLPLSALERLLAAAAALGLVEARDGGRWGLGALGAPLVGNRALTSMIEHHAVLYADLQDPLALLRGQGPPAALSRYWAYATTEAPGRLPAAQVDDYSALMSASQPLVADEVLDAYPIERHRCLLDLGGGQGRFLAAAARRAPHLQLMLFDLPAVVPAAQAAFAAQRLEHRATAFGGDFTRDPLPAGADIVSLVRVIYDPVRRRGVDDRRRRFAHRAGGRGVGAVLLALAATAYHAVAGAGKRSPIVPPDLIIGHGVLGRLLARMTVVAGFTPPTVWETNPARSGGAEGYPVIAPADDARRDYRAIYDMSGDAQILDRLVQHLAPGGEIVLAGFYTEPLHFNFAPAFMREAQIRCAAEWQRPDLPPTPTPPIARHSATPAV